MCGVRLPVNLRVRPSADVTTLGDEKGRIWARAGLMLSRLNCNDASRFFKTASRRMPAALNELKEFALFTSLQEPSTNSRIPAGRCDLDLEIDTRDALDHLNHLTDQETMTIAAIKRH
jgi:hypothetical protein